MNKLAAASAAHFCVDLCCAALFFGYLNASPDWWVCMILYNACAFALQFPLGLLADAWNRNLIFAALGCGLVAVGFFFRGFPVGAAVICGLGNGMFHVGGGLEVMNGSEKAAPLGVFVSPGAVGLYLGTVFASFFSAHGWLLPLIMLFTGLMLLSPVLRNGSFESQNSPLSLTLRENASFPLACLFFVVVFRSMLGGAFSAGLSGIPGVVPVLCLALGKAAGGFAGDRLGVRAASIVSLGGAALLLLFPPWTCNLYRALSVQYDHAADAPLGSQPSARGKGRCVRAADACFVRRDDPRFFRRIPVPSLFCMVIAGTLLSGTAPDRGKQGGAP